MESPSWNATWVPYNRLEHPPGTAWTLSKYPNNTSKLAPQNPCTPAPLPWAHIAATILLACFHETPNPFIPWHPTS